MSADFSMAMEYLRNMEVCGYCHEFVEEEDEQFWWDTKRRLLARLCLDCRIGMIWQHNIDLDKVP